MTIPNSNRAATDAANTSPLRVYSPTGITSATGGLSVQQEFGAIGLVGPGSVVNNSIGGIIGSELTVRGVVSDSNEIYLSPEQTIREIENDIFVANSIKNSKLLEQQIKIDALNQLSVYELENQPTKDENAQPVLLALQKAEIDALDENEKGIFERDGNKTSVGPLQIFGSEIKTGFQRPSRFRVRFSDSPKSLILDKSALKFAAELLKKGLICSSVTTPARTFETTELGLFGYDETYPTGTEFTSITCTFMLPISSNSNLFETVLPQGFNLGVQNLTPGTSFERNAIYQYFVAWQNSIQDVSQNGYRTFRFPNDYRLSAGFDVETFSNQINVMSEKNEASLGTRTTVTRYYDVYPKTITPGELSWNATDEFLTLSVEFLYTHWDDVTDSVPQYG